MKSDNVALALVNQSHGVQRSTGKTAPHLPHFDFEGKAMGTTINSDTEKRRGKAGAVRCGAVRIDTVDARGRLKARAEPYWTRITAGCQLGFRKLTPASTGTWVAKFVLLSSIRTHR